MKHFMILLLISFSICFADMNKIENYLPMYPDNDIYRHTVENFSLLNDYIAFE